MKLSGPKKDIFKKKEPGIELLDWKIGSTIYKGCFHESPYGDDMKNDFDYLSILAKNPSIDNSCFQSVMILDGPFDHFISRKKGCYPGQEVIEKIHAYGRRPKEMFALKLDSQLDTTNALYLFKDGLKLGQTWGPLVHKNKSLVALGFVQRNKCVSGDMLSTKDGFQVEIL